LLSYQPLLDLSDHADHAPKSEYFRHHDWLTRPEPASYNDNWRRRAALDALSW